ncbi:MAG: formylglycine-generating enzyme family protein [Pirellulaceae bacterium]
MFEQARRSRYFAAVSFVLLATATLPCPSAANDSALSPTPGVGIVRERPAEGRCVEVQAGVYMVPYSQTIPGTDVRFEMEPIPGGKFTMGSPDGEEGRDANEGPQVEVAVKPFWMARCETTWAEYKAFMAMAQVFEKFDERQMRKIDDRNMTEAVTVPSKIYDPSFTYASGDEPNLPAVSMSQYSAKQYTKWLSLLTTTVYRLPTEAEWEYACRAGTASKYYFGDDDSQLETHGWYYDIADDRTHDVGEKTPNAWGLHDMLGNVSEWVLDELVADQYEKLHALPQPVTAEQAIAWPQRLYPRVIRGGSWDDDPVDCRCAARRASQDDEWRSYDPHTPKSPWWFASEAGQTIGFRIVRPYEPPSDFAECSRFWDADLPQIDRDAERRIRKEGRGERGIVDPSLPKAIRELD